ncbi:molybdopterin-binding protein [soil metagenome]
MIPGPRFGLIVIGDEILSGRREDKHLSKVVALLSARGLELSWAHYLPDDRLAICEFLRRSMSGNDIVFSTGGIGGTPDDHTRQAAAMAAEVPLKRDTEAESYIIARATAMAEKEGKPLPIDTTRPEYQQRLTMADLPLGCDLIPNPYNQIAGFSIKQHFFVPGFPVMAWPMIEWVLDTGYDHLFHQRPKLEKSAVVFDVYEAQITGLMQAIEKHHAGIKVFSLPSVGDATIGRHIELGVKGDAARVDAAFDELLKGLEAFNARIGETLVRGDVPA